MVQSHDRISEELSLFFLDRLNRIGVQTPERIQTCLWTGYLAPALEEDRPQADMGFC